MRCTATAEMANELSTNAAVRYQNAGDLNAAVTAICGSATGAGARLGAGRRKSACNGAVVAARITASVSSALRHPCTSINQLESGEKTKLAHPPTRVTVVSARRRCSRNHFVTTVKAAS